MKGEPEQIIEAILEEVKKQLLENNEEKGYTMVNGIINVYKEKGIHLLM